MYLPVLGVALQHQRVFRLADLSSIIVLNLLDIFLGLDALVLGECTLMTLLE